VAVSSTQWTAPRLLIASWGVFGVLGVLSQALFRLTPLALEPVQKGMLEPYQWVIYVVWAVLNLYTEGYKGFQRGFNPRVVARAVHLAHHPKPLHVILAPAFCMSLFYATRKRLIVSWSLVIGITLVVVLVRQLDQPWRGIVDIGVVTGLGYGAAHLVVVFFKTLVAGETPTTDSLPARASTG